jgi:hypothetical protein
VNGGPTGRLHAADRDFFDALVCIRRQLEPTGWSIAVQGADLIRVRVDHV